jgi:hypothetical protein
MQAAAALHRHTESPSVTRITVLRAALLVWKDALCSKEPDQRAHVYQRALQQATLQLVATTAQAMQQQLFLDSWLTGSTICIIVQQL